MAVIELNQDYIDNIEAKISAAKTCEELSVFRTDTDAFFDKVILEAGLSLVPITPLSIPLPGTGPTVVWINGFIALNYAPQVVNLTALIVEATAEKIRIGLLFDAKETELGC